MRKLTNREIQIVRYSAFGSTAKEIAKITGLEFRTVENYMTKIRKKLGAKNIAHVVYIACQNSVINAI